LHEKLPGIAYAIELVVMRALAKDPHQRFASVQEFATAFDQVCQSSLPMNRTPPASQPAILFEPGMISNQPSLSSIPNTRPGQPPLQYSPNTPPNIAPQQFGQVRPPGSPQVRKRRVSRRVVLVGVAGFIVAGGSITWLLTGGFNSLISGGSSSSTNLTLTGQVVSVDLTNHTIIINVNGQTRTITNVPTNVLTNLQSQVGKVYSFQVTQNSDGSYSLQTGTNVTPEATESPTTTQSSSPTAQPVAFKAGGISYIGPVKSITSSSLVMSAPNGQTYVLTITPQTDRSAFGGSLPAVGASVNMDSAINPDGSLTATILKPAQPGDPNLNVIAYTGITTSAVGPDRVLHFTAGVKSYTFLIPATAVLTDFGGNAQAIANNVSVIVKVQYPANTVVSVGNASA
jgi:hypothetical protein